MLIEWNYIGAEQGNHEKCLGLIKSSFIRKAYWNIIIVIIIKYLLLFLNIQTFIEI